MDVDVIVWSGKRIWRFREDDRVGWDGYLQMTHQLTCWRDFVGYAYISFLCMLTIVETDALEDMDRFERT